MTRQSLIAIATVAVTAATVVNVNDSGALTIDEVQAVMPEITVQDCSQMDLNADGSLDAAEVQSAQEAGLMPA